jgi:hypothetical protein
MGSRRRNRGCFKSVGGLFWVRGLNAKREIADILILDFADLGLKAMWCEMSWPVGDFGKYVKVKKSNLNPWFSP